MFSTVHVPLFRLLVVCASVAALEHGLDQFTFVLNVLAQEELNQALADRSTPGSPVYQKWLSREQIDVVSRCWEGAAAVKKWASDNMLRDSEVTVVGCRVHVALSRNRWMKLTHCRINGANVVEVPPTLKDHVSFVQATSCQSVEGDPSSLRSQRIPSSSVTVDVLRKVYAIPHQPVNATNHQQPPVVVIYEAAQQFFSPDDLTVFQDLYCLPHTPVHHLHGYNTTSCVNHSCVEGNLLTQYITGLASGAVVEYRYLAGGDPFTAWILEAMNTTEPAPVQVISFLAMEQGVDPKVLDAFNTEALKLALMGVTIIVPAGDNGVANFPDRCDAASGNADQGHWKGASGWTGKGYFPSFPATSPYVTAVGATTGSESGNPEVACQSQLGGVITTGGGFSTYFPAPWWQQAAIEGYFASIRPEQTPEPGYNPLGRGFPDMALLGAHYAVVVQGEQRLVSSSAASAAVLAALVARLNSARLAENKTTVGFINPTLYRAHRQSRRDNTGKPLFSDVVSGNNRCLANTSGDSNSVSHPICCASGFYATIGWDPVTGLGSAQYTALGELLGVKMSGASTGGGSGGALSVGAIVGIAVGGFCAVAVVVAVMVWVYIVRTREPSR